VFLTLVSLGAVLLIMYNLLLPETNPAARRDARARTSVLGDYGTALSSGFRGLRAGNGADVQRPAGLHLDLGVRLIEELGLSARVRLLVRVHGVRPDGGRGALEPA
jgi:hypothetical protein